MAVVVILLNPIWKTCGLDNPFGARHTRASSARTRSRRCSGTIAQRLREVTVRPTAGVGERQRWDELMGVHHYLPFRTLVGRSVRHVAVLGERWLALVGWQAGAFKLRPPR